MKNDTAPRTSIFHYLQTRVVDLKEEEEKWLVFYHNSSLSCTRVSFHEGSVLVMAMSFFAVLDVCVTLHPCVPKQTHTQEYIYRSTQTNTHNHLAETFPLIQSRWSEFHPLASHSGEINAGKVHEIVHWMLGGVCIHLLICLHFTRSLIYPLQYSHPVQVDE